jgi:hypothetical protein
MQTVYACAICDESLPDDTPPLSRRYYYPVHARCAEAGEAVIGLAAAMLAEQRGALVCVACLAAELGISRVESASALWHLARQLPLAPGACGCGAPGCRLV